MFSDRIHQARLMADMTLAELGRQLGVSHTTVQKYEKGLLVPSSSQLLKIARVCHLRTEYFFRESSVDLKQQEFRCTPSFGEKKRQTVCLNVQAAVEKWIQLLNCYPEPPIHDFAVPSSISPRIHSLSDAEETSEVVRSAWALGLVPIGNMTQLLESLGILVIELDISDETFFGFKAFAVTSEHKKFPVIAVSKHWPGERQRFVLAHELGHLLFSGRLSADVNEEELCDRFAGAFLVPQAAVRRLLGGRRRDVGINELQNLKLQFGVSMADWVERSGQCGVVEDVAFKAMKRLVSSKGKHKEKSGGTLPREKSMLFSQLVFRALSEAYITESKAAELLGVSVAAFHAGTFAETADAADQ